MVFENALLLLTSEVRRRVVRRCALDGLARHVDGDHPVCPTDRGDPSRRHQNPMTSPPVARVHDDRANRPGPLVHKKILDVADLAVRGVEVKSDDAWQLRK